MGVLSIEESITYQIPLHRKLLLTGGFAIGYLSILEEIKTIEEAGQTEVDTWGNDIVTYILFGIEYDLGKKRTFFLESKYGSSDISNEFHIITGMNFYLKELVRQRWDNLYLKSGGIGGNIIFLKKTQLQKIWTRITTITIISFKNPGNPG